MEGHISNILVAKLGCLFSLHWRQKMQIILSVVNSYFTVFFSGQILCKWCSRAMTLSVVYCDCSCSHLHFASPMWYFFELPVNWKSRCIYIMSILNKHRAQDTWHLWQERGVWRAKGFFQAEHFCLKGSLVSVAQHCGALLFLTLTVKSQGNVTINAC